MPAHFRTYTIADQVSPGIDPADFDCILSESRLTACRLLAEELPGIAAPGADLRLWFVEPAEEADASELGVVASVDPSVWQPYASRSAELLDPGGRDGRVLVYLPASDAPVLVGSSGVGALFVHGSGEPEIRRVPKGITLRWALSHHEPGLARTPAATLSGATCRLAEAGSAP